MYNKVVKNLIDQYQSHTGNDTIDKEMIGILSAKDKDNYMRKNYKNLPMWYRSILLSILAGNQTDVITNDDAIRTIQPTGCNPLITIDECRLYNNLVTDLYMADVMTESMAPQDTKVTSITSLETLMVRLIKNFLQRNTNPRKNFHSSPEHFELLDEPLKNILNDIHQRSVAADIKYTGDYSKIGSYIEAYNKSKQTWEAMKSYPFRSYSIHETYEQIMAIDPEEREWVISIQPIFDMYTNRVIAMNILIWDTFVVPLAPRSNFSVIGNQQLSLYIATEWYYHNYITEFWYVETTKKLTVNNLFSPSDTEKYLPWVDEVQYEWKSGTILNKRLRYWNVKYIDISTKVWRAYLAHEDTRNEASYYSCQLWLLWYHYFPGRSPDRLKTIQDVSCSWSIIFI